LSNPIRIEENVPMAPLTTLQIGGPARFFARAETEEQVVEAFDIVANRGYDLFVLGETWDKIVALCVENDLAGVECLSGIPGFVGGTPIQNVGAYGQEVSETIVSVRCFDRRSNAIVELANADCGFTYRTSIFNSIERDRYVVLSVAYHLAEQGQPKVAYKDLRAHFGDRNPGVSEVREAVLSIRRSKSMVIDPDDPNSRSAGSFFKNPVVDRPTFDDITAKFPETSVPSFPASDERVKIPAAWLIERAGFSKGFRYGNVGISANHSLALVNFGGGTASEILALKEKIETAVQTKFDILLQHEPVFLGFD
jgi:UDP-N-acetylmuramate dehydrogenase